MMHEVPRKNIMKDTSRRGKNVKIAGSVGHA